MKSLFEVSNKESLKVADFIPTDLEIEDRLNLIDPIVHHEVPPLTSAKIIEIHMQGGAMGNLSQQFLKVKKRIESSCFRSFQTLGFQWTHW